MEENKELWGETLVYLTMGLMPHVDNELKDEGYDSHVAAFKLMQYATEFEQMVNDGLAETSSYDYGKELYKFMESKQDELVEWCRD